MLYIVTFTIHIPQILAYIYHTWILSGLWFHTALTSWNSCPDCKESGSTGFIGPPGKSLHGFSRDAKQTTVSSMPPLKLDDIENHALLWIDVVCWFGSKWCLFYNCSLFYIYIYMYIYYIIPKKNTCQNMFIPFFDDKWQMIANHHICRQITICADWITNFGSWKKQVDWIANCGSWNVICVYCLINFFIANSPLNSIEPP